MKSFLCFDLPMDMLLLCLTQLIHGRLCLRRLFTGMLVLSSYSIFAVFVPCLVHWPWWITVCFLSSAAITGFSNMKKMLESFICMLSLTSVCGGIASLRNSPQPQLLPAGVICSIFLSLVLRRKKHISYRWNIEIFVEKDGYSAVIPALIDTGNRLKEHRSGLPVIIAEASAIPELDKRATTDWKGQLRILPYGVLGSCGEIACFHPDRILMSNGNNRWICAPDCWVAIYRGHIPGCTRALAPPDFAEASDYCKTKFPEYKKYI